LNIHLWNLADDEGRLQELPQWIIGEVFPTDEDVTPGILREWLQELSDAGLVVRYGVDGERYIQCHDFRDHQKISHPTESVLPAFQVGLGVVTEDSGSAPGQGVERLSPEGKGKEEEGKRKRKSDAEASDAPLCELLADLIASNDPDGKRPTVTQRWRDAEDRMLRLDERKPEEAKRLIEWTQRDEFWRGNVLSMPTFREKYGQLYLAAVKDAAKQKTSSPGMAQAHRFAEKARRAEAEEAVA
jgi:hypothetical protein